ncbi:hypothetical protein KI387_020301, partial [Taxus chinensis]
MSKKKSLQNPSGQAAQQTVFPKNQASNGPLRQTGLNGSTVDVEDPALSDSLYLDPAWGPLLQSPCSYLGN